MSIQLQQRVKELERTVATLEGRILLLEMQQRPLESVVSGFPQPIKAVIEKPKRETITLRGRA